MKVELEEIFSILRECSYEFDDCDNGEECIENPLEECDDFGYFWDADDDYICEDEERMAFENE